ncbi:hypothetical protein [Brachybacterium timonense]|uniref:hypothetical protein n=1 Tax=Brachybacterium timonense TaxID=2050896 RepID=UPI00110E5788|nr:hypothetical protein [Brachybacterium timonense]
MSAPAPAPARPRRLYGVIVMLDALAWTAAVMLLVLGAIVGAVGMVLGVGEVFTPTPDGAQRVNRLLTAAAVLDVLAIIAFVATVIVDVVCVVLTLRRIRRGPTDPAVATLALVGISVGTVIPLALAGLFLLFRQLESGDAATFNIALMFVGMMVLAVPARLAQLIAGVVRTAAGDLPGVTSRSAD